MWKMIGMKMLTPSEREKLDHTHVEALGISSNAMSLIGLVGIITVGDCLYFFDLVKSQAMLTMNPKIGNVFFDEVEPRLIELGYLPHNWREINE
jgi:hypothetical protein